MNIQLNYYDRKVDFAIATGQKAIRGEGIAAFLEAIEKINGQIVEIRVSGETKSYTFARQVFLVVNLLSSLSGSRLIINGVGAKTPAFPDYNFKI